MGYVEIEVKAKTVDLAIEAAMQELGVDDPDQLSVDVISEPVKGFLGMGGQDAVVRVKKRRRRRRKKGKGPNQGKSQQQSQKGKHEAAPSAKNGRRTSQGRREKGPRRDQETETTVTDDRPEVSVEEQASIVQDFLEGLVSAYGLEGEVTSRVEEGVIVADVSGDQTEALVGVRGSVRSAIHELTRTVLQRYSQDTARLRLDIAGYGERRRQALAIYAEQLMDQLLEEGGEIMLEPMSPADRKVIHDMAATRERVTSYSEGEPPRRYVVLSLTDSTEEE